MNDRNMITTPPPFSPGLRNDRVSVPAGSRSVLFPVVKWQGRSGICTQRVRSYCPKRDGGYTKDIIRYTRTGG